MITIKRLGGDPLGVSQYELYLNDTLLIKSFDHNRPDDIAQLLHDAADAVARGRGELGDHAYHNTKH